jgi:RNA-directed DNA polymerase
MGGPFRGVLLRLSPGRSCHDAIARIFTTARPPNKKVWIVDADIKGAFDKIGHGPLLDAISTFPGRGLVKEWLKAGHMEDGVRYPGEEGVPQGGPISPLLANIALHGMEDALGIRYKRTRYTIVGSRALVRYADDFAILCESKSDAEAARAEIGQWLATRGLELSEEKTRIVHVSEGFDFLGFNIRTYRNTTSRNGWKLLIKPSKGAVVRLKRKLKAEWRLLQGTNADVAVKRLNPIVRGWANYYRCGVSKKTYHALDRWMWIRASKWARFRHPKKMWWWLKERYWGHKVKGRQDNWVFGTPDNQLIKFSWTKIERHVLVQGLASPDDASLRSYWDERRKKRNLELPLDQRRLARRQEGLCTVCGQSLHNGEELEKHHHVWKSRDGGNEEENLRLTHLFCHKQIHRRKREQPDGR